MVEVMYYAYIVARFLYCLQLCDDIKANRIHVDRETAVKLTALMLQGESDMRVRFFNLSEILLIGNCGNYESEVHQSGYYDDFPQFQFLPESDKVLLR